MSREITTPWSGRFIRVQTADGWEYVDRVRASGVVGVAAVDVANRLVLVEQHRPPVERRVIELPAGLAGDQANVADETLVDAARRELLEETGYASDHWTPLFHGPSSPGLCTEVVHYFGASAARKVAKGGGEGGEDITVHCVPIDEVLTWLHDLVACDEMLVDLKVYAVLPFLDRIAAASD